MNPTCDPRLTSWAPGADGGEFPIQNLPWGVFSTANARPRVGVRIGQSVLDMTEIARAGLLPGDIPAEVFSADALNAFIALGAKAWGETRARLSGLLRTETATLRDDAALRARALVPLAQARMHLPIRLEGFTDFYSSREHATNVGKMFRDPANALLPNWLHIPVGYNGRASTVVVSGTPVRRPLGQTKPPNAEKPTFGPCKRLDFELEMGVVVGAATGLGDGLAIAEADAAIFGYALLNDWSARDIQQWEYVPLGPFQAKAFATTLSPWIVTQEALAPFRVEGPRQDPEPLPYLLQSGPMNFDIALEASLRPRGAAAATVISRTNFAYMYWSSAQQLAHHASSGCAMRVGDLLGSGTISGASEDSFGSLLELAWGGQRPVTLADGSTRTFLEDGDTLAITGRATREGVTLGFGVCEGEILPAREMKNR